MSDLFIVHSAVVETTVSAATLPDGREVLATVPCLTVELVAEGLHGSMVRRYVMTSDEERAELLAKYRVGSSVVVTTQLGTEGTGYPDDHRERAAGAAQPVYRPEE